MIRFKNLSAAALAVLALLVAGCNDGGGTVSPNRTQPIDPDPREGALLSEWTLNKDLSADQSLVGTSWRWYGIDGDCAICRWKPASPSPFGYRAYSLEFKDNGTLKMYSWGNEYFGFYNEITRDNDVAYEINIFDFWGTEVGLVESSPDEEWMATFPSVKAFALNGDRLKLYYNDGNDGKHYSQLFINNEPVRCKERPSSSQAKSLCVPLSPEF